MNPVDTTIFLCTFTVKLDILELTGLINFHHALT